MIDYEKRRIRARSIRKSLLKKPTISELKFKDILDEMGLKYKFQKKIFAEKNFYIADFYLIKHKIMFEIDGGIHNDNFGYDEDRELEILKAGSVKFIVRFPNKFIENNKEETKKEIIDILNKRGEMYQGLIDRKSKILNEIGKEKYNEKQNRRFLKNQLIEKPYLKSRLTTNEYGVISMLLGLNGNNPHSLEEIYEKTYFSKDKIEHIIGKLYWLIKTD